MVIASLLQCAGRSISANHPSQEGRFLIFSRVVEKISIPLNYDWKAQERIEKNRRALMDHCEEAMPFLIEGCTDARYSLTSRFDEDTTYSWCVGQICLEIIAHHVEVFREHMRFHGPHDWKQYNFIPRLGAAIGENVTDKRKIEIQEWWRGHKGMSLRDLQLAAFDWAIEKREDELKRLSHGNRGENAENEKRASDGVKSLVSTRDELRRSKICLPPKRMWPSIVSPKGYRVAPWREKDQ
jgi:hypothetical protein